MAPTPKDIMHSAEGRPSQGGTGSGERASSKIWVNGKQVSPGSVDEGVLEHMARQLGLSSDTIAEVLGKQNGPQILSELMRNVAEGEAGAAREPKSDPDEPAT